MGAVVRKGCGAGLGLPQSWFVVPGELLSPFLRGRRPAGHQGQAEGISTRYFH